MVLGLAPSTRTEPSVSSTLVESAAAFYSQERGSMTWWSMHLPDVSWEPWLDYAQHRIKEAFRLPANWDYEGGDPISRETALFAGQVAEQLSAARLTRPFVSPTHEGAIAFEWSGGPADLVITVADAQIFVSVRDAVSGAFQEGPWDEMDGSLSRALVLLSR